MRSALLLLLPLAASAANGQCLADPDHPVVELQTSEGVICIELFPEAPETVANFLGYVSRGDYDGTFFHRSVSGFVIQGGGFAFEGGEYRGLCTGGCPTVDSEWVRVSEALGCGPALETPGCNVRGTVAMARVGGNLDSATSQWFINLSDDNVFLDDPDAHLPPQQQVEDDGFTIFGRVVDMTVADDIAALPLVDGEFVLRTPLRSVMSELPVTSALPASCFDLTDVSVVLTLAAFCRDPNTLFASDPLLGPPAPPFFYFVSPSCFGAPDGCSGDLRTLATCRIHREDDGVLVYSDDLGTPTTPASCEAREASDLAQAALAEEVSQRLVQVSRAFVVPEPGPTLSRLAVLAALAGVARRRRS